MEADSPSTSAAKEGDTMAKTMTASQMTNGQIDSAVDQLRDAMRKHREEVDKEGAQHALGVNNLGMRMFTVFRELAEAASKIIRRAVRVDRTRTATEVIDATSRVRWYVDEQVLAEMPLDGREEDTIEFFELDYDPDVEELDREYETRDLRPDPATVAQAMIDDPTFADERPVAVQWRDNKGRACYMFFHRFVSKRGVSVDWGGGRWGRVCRFAGVRK